MSTDTIRLFRDGEPRTATSILTQLLSSERYDSSGPMLLYVHRHNKAF